MATITTLNSTDSGSTSRNTINTNFANLAVVGAVFSGGAYAVSSDAATTSYIDTEMNDSETTTETECGNIIPFSGTLKNLYVRITANTLDSGSVTYTVMKNGASTSITCTTPSGGVGILSDTTNTVSVTAGDRISIKIVCTGASGAVNTSALSYMVN